MLNDVLLFLPEIAVLLAALVSLFLAAFAQSYRTTWAVSVMLAAGVLAVTCGSLFADGQPFFEGIYEVDAFSQVLKAGIAVGLLLTLLVSGEPGSVRERTRSDMPFFLFLSTAGMMMLMSATELLTLYVALELSAYGLYIIAALNRRQGSGSEAGAKYILFGAASSAISLYGISLIFAVAHTTYVDKILAMGFGAGNAPLMIVGALMVLAGLLFKLGAFPFHSWVPDTYQGAPHQSAAFIGTASKVAGVGVLIRVLSLVAADAGELVQLLVLLCVASMTVGNLAALVQRDIKRLLAYSTIAHAGYILMGLLTMSPIGTAAALFYVLVYVPIAFAPFLVVAVLGKNGENPTLHNLAMLFKRAPLMAVMLLLGMFGLAGIPPTAGFIGKWFLFSAALERGMFWLVLIGAVNATIGLYYYLQVVRAAYVPARGASVEPKPLVVSRPIKLAAWVTIGLLAVSGFYPGPLWDFCQTAATAVDPAAW